MRDIVSVGYKKIVFRYQAKDEIRKVYLIRFNLDYIEDYTQRAEIKFKRFCAEDSFTIIQHNTL